MSIDINFDGVSVNGSPVIFRKKLGQYQLLVCKNGFVYSMTTSWGPKVLFSMDTLGKEIDLGPYVEEKGVPGPLRPENVVFPKWASPPDTDTSPGSEELLPW